MSAHPYDPADPYRPVIAAEVDALRASIDALGIRGRLGRKLWAPPVPWGEGWKFSAYDRSMILVTPWREGEDTWLHASMSRPDGAMPSYDDLKMLHAAVWPDGFAYQCFVPPSDHINITANVLHLWGRIDGSPVLPNFGRFGTI